MYIEVSDVTITARLPPAPAPAADWTHRVWLRCLTAGPARTSCPQLEDAAAVDTRPANDSSDFTNTEEGPYWVADEKIIRLVSIDF